MRSMVCRTLLCVVWFGLIPEAGFAHSARGAASTMTLRFHYVTGQVLDYLVTGTVVSTSKQAGKAGDTTKLVVVNHQIYTFHTLDLGGDASLSIVSTDAKATSLHHGKTTHSTIPGSHFGTPTDACLTETDGTGYCSYRGAYGLNDIGQLSSGPVRPGSVWSTVIDNTWSIQNRKPVMIRNQLLRVSPGASGPVATIVSSMHQSGRGIADPKLLTNAELSGKESGTWQFAVDSGRFLGEDLVQTLDSSGIAHDKAGARAVSMHDVAETIMKLVSVRSTRTTRLVRAYATITRAGSEHTTSAYRLTTPSSWTAQASADTRSMQLTAPDGLAVVTVVAPSKVPAGVTARTLVNVYGTPIGGIGDETKSTLAGSLRSIDAVVRLAGKQTEAQIEIRVLKTTAHTVFELGIVSLGVPGMGAPLRPTNFAQEYEQVLATLNSLRMQ